MKTQETIFLEVLEENKDRIFRLSSIYSSNPDDAKDLFQEVTLNIWKSLANFRQDSDLNTWIYRIALNVCLRARSETKKKEDIMTNLDSVIFRNVEVPIETDNSDQLASLKRCIRSLNNSDKSIILLHLEEMPYTKISEITGLSENHIAVKMKRIKAKLFTCIETQTK